MTFSLKPVLSPFFVYLIIVFLAGTGDAIMSYIAPVIIEEHVNSTLLMGLVLSFSSVVGFVCDFTFSKIFHGKPYSFFLCLMFAIALLFPLSFVLLPPIVLIFLFAMAAWGIYFELLQFSHFHFLHAHVQKEKHADSWGMLETVIAIAYFVGPFIATKLIDTNLEAPHYAALACFTSGLLGLLLFMRLYRKKHHIPPPEPLQSVEEKAKKHSYLHELKVWRVLWKKIWPLYLFMFALVVVDSSFWTIGTIISEELRDQHPMGGLLLPAATFPALFMGLFTAFIAKPFGKKRAAFLAGILGGLLLSALMVVTHVPTLILFVFLYAVCIAVSRPEIYAVFEDYVVRLGKRGNDLIGMQSSAGSLAFIVGPIVAGALGEWLGNTRTLGILGLFFVLSSVLALLVVPRKIKMPVTELSQVDSV